MRPAATLLAAVCLLVATEARGALGGSPSLTVPPAGNGADDGPRLMSAIATAAARGGCVQLTPGLYTIHTTIVLVSHACVLGTPGTVLQATLPSGGGPGGYLQDVFYSTAGTPSGAQFSSTLATNTTNGSNAISVTAGSSPSPTCPSVGTWLELENSAVTNVAQLALVTAVSGSGPCTVTLNRPIGYAETLTSGSVVVQEVPVTDVRIDGRGMEITGTGDRAFEAAGCQRCTVRDVRITARLGTFGAITGSFDVASADSGWENVTVDGGSSSSAPSAGLALESCYRCRMVGVRVSNLGTTSSQYGLFVVDDIDAQIVAPIISGGAVGMVIASGSATPTAAGSRRVTVLGGAIEGASVYGALVEAPEIDFVGTSFAYNAVGLSIGYGSAVGAANGGPVRLVGVRGQSNTNGLVQATSGDVHLIDVVSRDDGAGSGSTAYAVSTGMGSNPVNWLIQGGDYELSTDVLWYGLYLAQPGMAIVGGGVRYEHPSAHTTGHASIVLNAATQLLLGDVSILGAPDFGVYAFGVTNAVVRYGASLTISAATGTQLTVTSPTTSSSWAAFYSL